MLMLVQESVVSRATALVLERQLDVTRCSETGAPVGTLTSQTIHATLEAYWLDSPAMTADQLADLWEESHFLLNFRISPQFQRTLVAQQRENRYARLAQSANGRAMLFAYFLTRILYPTSRAKAIGSMDYYSERNRFLAFTYDWAAGENAESFIEDMILNLSLLEALTDVGRFIRERSVQERVKGLLPALRELDETEFESNVEQLVRTLWEQLRLTDDEVAAANQPVARAVSISLGNVLARENREAKAAAALREVTQRFQSAYGGGKVQKRTLTLKKMEDRLKPKAERSGNGRGTRQTKMTAEAKAEIVSRFSAAMKSFKMPAVKNTGVNESEESS